MLPLLLTTLLAGAPTPGPWHGVAVPETAYSSDVGLTLGVAATLYRVAQPEPERRDRLSLALVYTTRGPSFVEGRWYGYHVLGTPLRTAWDVRLDDDNRAPYWGEGAALGGLTVSPGSGTPPPEYRYHDRRVFASALVAAPIAGALEAYGRLRVVRIDLLAAGPLLLASRPAGSGGGDVALLEGGLVLDDRDREVGTRRGVYASASVFGSPALGGAFAHRFGGGNVTVRTYVPLPLGTLAARVMVDVKRGHVPFFERTVYEGVEFGDGLGGAETVRGVARYRLAGEEKLLANLELRRDVCTLYPLSRSLEVGVAAGVDAGAAHQGGYPAVAAVGGFAGARLLWDKAILLRLELGYAGEDSPAVYVIFGEEF